MIYFISDIHLGFQSRSEDRKNEEILLTFLEKIQSNTDTLVIVGDLFDYWFDYGKVIPKNYYRSLTAIDKLVRSGMKIEYIIGNHDFGHYRFFKEEFGITPSEGDIEREYNGKKFYLSHGDGKSNNDTGYRILKKILRSRLNQNLFRKIHPDIGIWLASGSSRKSRHYTDTKYYGEVDGMREFAYKKIEEGFDYVIMGHSHKLGITSHKNGFYVNLGEWIKNPHFAVFDGEKLELKSVRDYLQV
jgi:UDP-2,3-diacylglucosamine hydrolase